MSTLINQNIDEIFGQAGPLRQKFEGGYNRCRAAHPNDTVGLQNYIKRTFSKPIKSWYILNRSGLVGKMDQVNIQALPRHNELFQYATNAQAGRYPSVGAYLKSIPQGVVGQPLQAAPQAAAVAPQ